MTRPVFQDGDTDLTRGMVFQCVATIITGRRCRHYRWYPYPYYTYADVWTCKQHRS